MSIFSSFGKPAEKIFLLGEAALSAFQGDPIPAGWDVLSPIAYTKSRIVGLSLDSQRVLDVIQGGGQEGVRHGLANPSSPGL